MWYEVFLKVFLTIFLAELGDKTQLATLLFAAQKNAPRWVIFFAASLALILAAGIGTLAGNFIAAHVSPRVLKFVAGAVFIIMGVYTLVHS
ncbi:MAG: TMEM165/GDT1 family protein [Leptospiraceae bacterium]|nr:TMEM165/GDT1 family protein [Leptospiraceae bacterium]MDW8306542.1 TMEM165/GDT1 family protein [Leptospiraceae bacterium]